MDSYIIFNLLIVLAGLSAMMLSPKARRMMKEWIIMVYRVNKHTEKPPFLDR